MSSAQQHNWNKRRVGDTNRGTQREYTGSSKPLKHTIVKRILVFKR